MAGEAKLQMQMYRKMLRIRRFEQRVWEIYTAGLMDGLAHLYIGEEAVAVGVCSALEDQDYITSTHRGHGHCVAKGGRLDQMMAEVMGKVSGYCRGKGGSMHIADLSLGILGANGIVGGGFGIATGAALSSKLRRSGQVTACFFGDGAANQGIFFEVMNYAAIWTLPVIYICENNQYGEYTPVASVTAGRCIADRAKPFGIPAVVVDGNDVLAVHDAAADAVGRARAGDGPTLIECATYRQPGHHVGDPGTSYRTKEEVEVWKGKDPIERLRRSLLEDGRASQEELDAVGQKVARELDDAVTFAEQAPYPDVKEVRENVYA